MIKTFRSRISAPLLWTRLARGAVLILWQCALLILVIVSMFEVFKTIADNIRDLEKDKEILLAGALVAALVPSGAVLFWGFDAIAIQLNPLIKTVCRFFRDQNMI
jgi:hypothetical protein